MRHLRATVLVLGVIFTASCAGNSQEQGSTDTAGIDPLIPNQRQANKETTVRVENQAFADMVIYVLQGSSRIRIGQVSGNSTATLRIPQTALGSGTVQFLADPIGGNRTPISDTISVQPGDQVQLTIPPN
jgi:hypothetical protein